MRHRKPYQNVPNRDFGIFYNSNFPIKIGVLKILISLFCLSLIPGCFGGYRVETRVEVLDQEGRSISGAQVSVTYPPINTSKKFVSHKGVTNSNGVFLDKGTSFYRVAVVVSKAGYYDSSFRNIETHRSDGSGGRVIINPDFQVILKRIVRPIPMIAYQGFLKKMPVLNKPVGFDFEFNDWVVPYGDGKTSDIFFEINGYFHSVYDFETEFRVSFPNDGDGLISFNADINDGSRLMSPAFAPESGYKSDKIWQFSRYPKTDDRGILRVKSRLNDMKSDEHLLIRVRTVRDENGNIVSAHYGKIYGPLMFGPIINNEAEFKFLSYYLNPTSNDKGLEFDQENSLVYDLPQDRWHFKKAIPSIP